MRRPQRLRSGRRAGAPLPKAVEAAAPVRRTVDGVLPLSALLSQLLVAFTVEADNEFERRLAVAGYRGERLSLVVWLNLLQFVPEPGLAIADLVAQTRVSDNEVRHQLACLERWGYLWLGPDRGEGARPTPTGARRRSGWGSGRGLRLDWRLDLTAKGREACTVWRPISDLVERRWEARWGAGLVTDLRESLSAVVRGVDLDFPEGFPAGSCLTVQKQATGRVEAAPVRLADGLARALMAFTLAFDHDRGPSLAMCASTVRVLTEAGALVSDLPWLTGNSPEVTAIGWRWKQSGLLSVGSAPRGRRGQMVRLTPAGLDAQRQYRARATRVEERWAARVGGSMSALRQALAAVRSAADADGLLLSHGLVPPAGVVRAGEDAPALGRRDLGPAAAQRRRDLVAQTRAFVADPAGALPHYPLWDMNRGFGP